MSLLKFFSVCEIFAIYEIFLGKENIEKYNIII